MQYTPSINGDQEIFFVKIILQRKMKSVAYGNDSGRDKSVYCVGTTKQCVNVTQILFSFPSNSFTSQLVGYTSNIATLILPSFCLLES